MVDRERKFHSDTITPLPLFPVPFDDIGITRGDLGREPLETFRSDEGSAI